MHSCKSANVEYYCRYITVRCRNSEFQFFLEKDTNESSRTYSWLKVWLTVDRLFVAIPWWGCCCGIGRMCTMHGDCCCCCKGRIWTMHEGFWLWLSCCCGCEWGTSRTCVPKLFEIVGSMTGPSGKRWMGVITSPCIEDLKARINMNLVIENGKFAPQLKTKL